MTFEQAMNTYCKGLSRLTIDADESGIDVDGVCHGLLAAIAITVRDAGGDDHVIAATFRSLADHYEDSANRGIHKHNRISNYLSQGGQHGMALTESTARLGD